MNTPSHRFIVLASPHGDLTLRRADLLRRFPNLPSARWPRLIQFRLREPYGLERLRADAYRWAIARSLP